MTDARAAAARWAQTWKHAWEALDPDPIVALYAPDAVFSSEPFRDPYRGPAGVRTYVERVFGEEGDVRVRVSAPIVSSGASAATPSARTATFLSGTARFVTEPAMLRAACHALI